MKNILFPTLGSAGDVYPLITICREMNQRGFHSTIIASPVFQTLVQESQLDFIPLGTQQQFNDLVNNPDLWHPTRGFQVVVKQGILPFLLPLMEIIRSFSAQDSMIVSPLLLFGSHVAHQKFQYPLITLQLQPSLLRSIYAPPVLGSTALPGWITPKMVRFYYKALDKMVIDPILAPELNSFRGELGLLPIQRIFNQHLFSPTKNIGLFPEWFAPPQPDWPENTTCTGFIASAIDMVPFSEALQRFLESGDAPLVFTAGTAMRLASDFFETAIEVCQSLKKRAVLLTHQTDQLPANLPENILHQNFVNLSKLLPYASAFVYHGGIGSLAQAVATGIPQLIMPMSQDQPDNAARIQRLGLGESIRPQDFTPKNVTAKLKNLLSDPEIHARCKEFAGKIDFEIALEITCQEITASF